MVLCAAGCKPNENKVNTMSYLPTAQLVTEIEKADTTPTSGTITSSPIPVFLDHRLLIAVFRATAGYDPEARGSVLSPPARVTFFDPGTGARVKEEPRPHRRRLPQRPLSGGRVTARRSRSPPLGRQFD